MRARASDANATFGQVTVDGLGQDVSGARDEQAELGRKALVAVGWNGLQMWGYNAVALGVFIVLARLLEPRQFGLVADAMVIVTLLRVIVDAGFSRLLVQRAALDRTFSDAAFWAAALLGVTFAAATIAAAPLLAALFSQPRLTMLVRALSLIFVFAALDSVPTALLQRELNWRTQALRRLGATVASAAVAISLAILGAGAWALVGQQLTLEGLTVVLLWALVQWRPRLRFSAPAFKALVGFGTRYSVLRILWYLGSNVDNFLIGVFLGPVALGFYVLAYRVFTVLNELLVSTINNVAMPMFARMQSSPSAVRASLLRTSTLTFLLSLPVYAGLALIARQLVPALFGARWTHSVPVLELLTVAGCLQAQLAVMTSYVIATDRVKREVPWAFCVMAAQVGGFAVAVHFGITAVAAALAGVLVVAWPTRLFMLGAWDKLPLADYFKQLRPIVVSTLAMAAVVAAARLALEHQPAALSLPVEVVVGAVVYVGLLSVLAPARARDVRAWLSRALGLRRRALLVKGQSGANGVGEASGDGSGDHSRRREIDVLVVAANTTSGLRRDFDEIVGALHEAGLSFAVATPSHRGLLAPLRRLSLATDELIVAASLRRATMRTLARARPRAVLITTSSAGGLLPKRLLHGSAVRFDALAASFRARRRDALTHGFERRALSLAALALPSSEQANAALLSLFDGRPRSVVWPSVVRRGPASGRKEAVGLCYANDPHKKGLDLAVRAWSRAAPASLPLLITGIDRRMGERFLAARGLAAPANVRWLGFLPEAEYRRLSASALLYISASRVEQFGTAQLEALLDGALLVAVPSKGPVVPLALARQLDHRLVAAAVDADALAAAIEAALAMGPETQARYRARARELLAPYTREAFVETLRERIVPVLLGHTAGDPETQQRSHASGARKVVATALHPPAP